MQKSNIDIHFHEFPIFKRRFLVFRKIIGNYYMKCGTDGYGTYIEGLPEVTGIEIFKIGKFGECPKSDKEIQSNKDSQGAEYL